MNVNVKKRRISMSKAGSILSSSFWHDPENIRQRIERKDMKELLLEGEPVLACGNLWDIKHKHLGLGVYEVWLEKKVYGDG
jgi:hypothetical protein